MLYYICIMQEHQTKKMQGRGEQKMEAHITTPYRMEMKKGQCRKQHCPF